MRSTYQASMKADGVDLELAALRAEALIEVGNTSRLSELC